MTENPQAGKAEEHSVKTQYERVAAAYDHRWRGYIASSLSFLERRLKLKGNEKILDVACGTGELEKLLISRHPALDITGIDFSERMLSVASAKLKPYPNVCFHVAGASELPFDDKSFDLVVSASAFHYFDEPKRSLLEMCRVLRPGGKVVILDWCRNYIICRLCDLALKVFDPAYKQCYGQRELRRFLEEARLRVLDERRFRIRLIWGMMIAEAVVPDGI